MANTRTIVTAALAADSSVTQAMANAALRILEGKTADGLTNQEPMDRVLTRQQVAEILHKNPRTVSVYARQGRIRRIIGGTLGKRASGYSEESVRAYLKGQAAA